ncbi:MAG: hypothetical protein HZB35_05405 [Nitrospirae bacterium]|nr:hypothetical protein [Nitrospirota bacterium]
MNRIRLVTGCLLLVAWMLVSGEAPAGDTPGATAGGDFQIEITKKSLGKEVSIRKGHKEWFMMVEVTPENTVVIRQEKENDTFLLDESETHDHSLSAGEVDTAIQDFINSVKTQVKKKK